MHPDPEPQVPDLEPETMETQEQGEDEDNPEPEKDTEKGEKEKSVPKEEKQQKRKEKVEEKRELAGTIFPRRHGHMRFENKSGEMWTAQIVQRAVAHNGTDAVWTRNHDGNCLELVYMNQLRGWEYMSNEQAQKRKEFLARWEDHEKKEGKEPKSARAAQELEQRWRRMEERERNGQYRNGEQEHDRDRWESMSQPVTRSKGRWRC